MSQERIKDRLIPLSRQDLDLLEWFAQWTPEVHRANWKVRRTWPPGFRESADTSVHRLQQEAAARMADTGDRRSFGRIRDKLLPFRLVEGTITCARLTPRGRAALKLYGRECPESFESHCPEIFDDVSLRVVFQEDFTVTHLENLKSRYDWGEVMDDTAETWSACLAQYNENVYSQRGSGQSATVAMLKGHSTGQPLNGSLRLHSDVITVRVRNNDHREICDFQLSLEQLADMLTSNGDVPCTVNSYFGPDGMRYSEPAPPVISAYERMQARLENQTDSQADRLAEIITTVEGLKMGKRAKEALLHDLRVAKNLGIKNHAYAAEQTLEEVSQVIEGAGTILQDRLKNGTLLPGGGVLGGLLGEDSQTIRLLEMEDDSQ